MKTKLAEALARIGDADHWWRGGTPVGIHHTECAITAVMNAWDTDPSHVLSEDAELGYYADTHALDDAIRAHFGERVYEGDTPKNIAAFNDHPDTTWDDLKKVFTEAMAHREAEEA